MASPCPYIGTLELFKML